ncbi:MAG TPA: phytanoyl-CoA dioxygenase family protein [Acidimicrobiales bacterium]|nr:phytanoyl-CoA dioxygenase family protein [Acidimicrobiales bacterium]
MISVDQRTRTAADEQSVDPSEFFDQTLPARFDANTALAAPGARELDLRPIAVEVDGTIWQLAFDGQHFTVGRAHDAASARTHWRLDAESLSDLVNDTCTPVGLMTGGDLDLVRGPFQALLDWTVVLRSVIDGRPLHTTGSVEFHDRDGSPLGLHRAFRIGDDPDDIAHFLGEAGFLHLEGVFDPEEMAEISADMDRAAADYSPGDNRSWWAETDDGTNRLVRMQYFQDRSPATAAMLTDDRLQSIARLTTDGHRNAKPGPNRNLVEALVKPLGVVKGISDVPWHKDCSLGSHSYRCCSLTVGISVTGADAASGQLRVVAGSHRTLIQAGFVRDNLDLPQIDLPTSTGDVTVHLSCTLHMSQPPVQRERRVLYTDFSMPSRDGGRAPGETKLARIREGAPTTVSQPAARR